MATVPIQTSPSDPALAYAQRQLHSYRRALGRARFFHQAGEMTILLTTAATVVVAALHASAIITASIASVTLFLTGFRQVFGPSENWLRAAPAWADVDHAILRYKLIPESERDVTVQRELMEKIIAISLQESAEWATQQSRRAANGAAHERAAREEASALSRS